MPIFLKLTIVTGDGHTILFVFILIQCLYNYSLTSGNKIEKSHGRFLYKLHNCVNVWDCKFLKFQIHLKLEHREGGGGVFFKRAFKPVLAPCLASIKRNNVFIPSKYMCYFVSINMVSP